MCIKSMKMNRLILVLTVLFAPFIYAENKVDFASFTLENDSFYNEDGLYTGGWMAEWGYDDVAGLDQQVLPDWLAYLAEKSYLSHQKDKQYFISYRVAHLQQTAIDITESDLIEEDAPYVGLFAWESNLMTYDTSHIDRLSLVLGMVGPAAGAKAVQTGVHVMIAANTPEGWDNQINNEPVIRLQAEKSWRIYNNALSDREFDIVTGMRGGIGNLRSDLGAGAEFRWGQGLQGNFSSSSAFPRQKLNGAKYAAKGWYVFANSAAFYVGNDIFIDGNTFENSHHVDLIHFQYGASLGVMAHISSWNVTFTLLQLSDQYQGQNERSQFGSVTFTYLF